VRLTPSLQAQTNVSLKILDESNHKIHKSILMLRDRKSESIQVGFSRLYYCSPMFCELASLRTAVTGNIGR
jgi:hypothetical protein